MKILLSTLASILWFCGLCVVVVVVVTRVPPGVTDLIISMVLRGDTWLEKFRSCETSIHKNWKINTPQIQFRRLQLYFFYGILTSNARHHLDAASAAIYFIITNKKCQFMSSNMTKPTKWVCAQWRLRSAWVSAQSDQSLRCALIG